MAMEKSEPLQVQQPDELPAPVSNSARWPVVPLSRLVNPDWALTVRLDAQDVNTKSLVLPLWPEAAPEFWGLLAP